ncbi:hypothetical protein D3C84_948300 [compost metagenome]
MLSVRGVSDITQIRSDEVHVTVLQLERFQRVEGFLEPIGSGRAHAQFIEMNQAHTVSGHFDESPFPGTARPTSSSASTVLGCAGPGNAHQVTRTRSRKGHRPQN